MNKNLTKEKGLIKYIFYIFIIILVLSYFGFNLKEFWHSDAVQNNLGFIWDWLVDIWTKYLKPIYDFLTDWFGPFIKETLDGLRNHNDIITPHIPDLVPPVK